MGFLRSLIGAVRIELISANCESFIHNLNEIGITVEGICPTDELTFRFTVARQDIPLVQEIAERKGECIRIVSYQGIIWTILSLRARSVLLAGLALLFVLCCYLPSRILFVSVEGNTAVPEKRILEAAREAGIHFGAARREVRSEKVKNRLLEELPQLQWAGVNTDGCRAVITVKERAAAQPVRDNLCSDIVSACDGIITSCTVLRGTSLCTVGQAVRKGQTLISGSVEIGGLHSDGKAEGEIFAETYRDFSVLMPYQVQSRSGDGMKQVKISLLFGKKRINFYKGSGISDTSCVKMVTQYQLSLPGGYRLPISLILETTELFRTEAGIYPKTNVSAQLTAFAKDYLSHHTIALVILESEERMYASGSAYEFHGRYRCIEMIGREQRKQIGDFHGKAD